jgi:3'(2'), 5'-bisphosphate nucleotidase
MPSTYERELQVGIDAIRHAAKLCRAVQAGIEPEALAKKDKSPVTVADFGSQALVCRALHEAFADAPVIAEEDSSELKSAENAPILDRVTDYVRAVRPEANGASVCDWIDRGRMREFCDRFWTLDPIDGTKGFLRKEQFAVSLALIVAGRIEVGILGCPNLPPAAGPADGRGAIFFAIRGHGAFAQSLDDPTPAQSIRVSSQHDAAHARFCESVESGHSSHNDAAAIAARLGITHEPLRMDSQAKYAVVARGEAEIYLRMPTRADYREKIWDHAGGVLVVTEAGGTVTDITGKPLEFTHGPELIANRGVIVTNGPLHDRVLNAVQTAIGQ